MPDLFNKHARAQTNALENPIHLFEMNSIYLKEGLFFP